MGESDMETCKGSISDESEEEDLSPNKFPGGKALFLGMFLV